MKKKNMINKAFSLLLALMMVMGFATTAFAADASVTFKNGKLVVFQPGSNYTDTDLFGKFKNIMPGDILNEEITVENQSGDSDYIKVYLRAVPHDETGNPISEKVLAELSRDERRGEKTELAYMYDFLAQLQLTVKNGAEVIYQASPDETGGLTNNVYLGSLRKGQSLKLDVELKVPIEMGNDYANRIGEVDWVFAAEAFNDVTPPPEGPDTTPYYPPEEPSDNPSLFTVRKVWVDDGKSRPKNITVQLLRDGEVYSEVKLRKTNNWVHTWDRLDKNHRWSVVEADVADGYKDTYKARGNTVIITNTQEDYVAPQTAKPVDLTVVKKWDDKGKNRPDSVKATLYDGDTAVETVLLGDWNDWSYSWKKLDGKGNWQIVETNIPKGYVPSYSYEDGVVTITNTATLIQTGQLNWPIPVMCGLGLALIIYGVIVLRKKRKNERA